jgi:hypothetical protein
MGAAAAARRCRENADSQADSRRHGRKRRSVSPTSGTTGDRGVRRMHRQALDLAIDALCGPEGRRSPRHRARAKTFLRLPHREYAPDWTRRPAGEKARDNLAAIRLLKTMEADNREATEEEKAVLARHVGWGTMPNYSDAIHQEWGTLAGAVKDLVTGRSGNRRWPRHPNAHYTSPPVIKAIWSGLQRLGLGRNAQILEPAMGVGHFFRLMPEFFGGDPSGAATGQAWSWYHHEETPLPDNYFDVVTGNVPFGRNRSHDRHSASSQTCARSAAGGPCLARAGNDRQPGRTDCSERILRPPPRDDARDHETRRNHIPRR